MNEGEEEEEEEEDRIGKEGRMNIGKGGEYWEGI
jgi:hypothetical protein